MHSHASKPSAACARHWASSWSRRWHRTEKHEVYARVKPWFVPHYLFVGDIVDFDAARGLAEFESKNKLSQGDRIELVQPEGVREFVIEQLLDKDGKTTDCLPGSGHKGWVKLPKDSLGAFVAKFVA
jgi:hypothetical protein